MALTVTTNMPSLVVQNNLNNATKSLNQSIERMSTGYKINSAKDDAAGYAVATKFETNISSTSVAQDNVSMGSSLLSTSESNYDIIIDHCQRIRDLVEQGANGTYGSEALTAMLTEVNSRLAEIDRIANSTEYNDIKLMNGDKGTSGITLQVGITSAAESRIVLEAAIFKNASASSLLGKTKTAFTSNIFKTTTTSAQWTQAFTDIDKALTDVTTRQTKIGANQNRLESAGEALTIQYDNLTESLSVVKDTDVAAESSNYVQAQILQQASATLLTTANQAPSIALSLI